MSHLRHGFRVAVLVAVVAGSVLPGAVHSGAAAPTDVVGRVGRGAPGGLIFSFGDAAFYGSTGNLRLAQPIVGMAATPSGHGYWLAASDGGIFSFGDAAFAGAPTGTNQPIIGLARSPTGGGYWLGGRDGGVFAYGDAGSYGATGNVNQPIIGIDGAPRGGGYWLAARDGGIFSFGTARFLGSTGALHLNRPIVGIAGKPEQ